MNTLSDGTTTITLGPDLLWTDRHSWSAVRPITIQIGVSKVTGQFDPKEADLLFCMLRQLADDRFRSVGLGYP